MSSNYHAVAKEAERYAAQAEQEFDDPIGRFYASAILVQAKSITASPNEDQDAEMPGCSVLLEQFKNAAQDMLPLVRAVLRCGHLHTLRQQKDKENKQLEEVT